MSNSIQRDQQRRIIFARLEGQRLQYKSAIRDLSIPTAIRALSVERLNGINRRSSLTRVRNRCVLSGRGRGVQRFLRLSRIKFRELAGVGLLVGVSKSSW